MLTSAAASSKESSSSPSEKKTKTSKSSSDTITNTNTTTNTKKKKGEKERQQKIKEYWKDRRKVACQENDPMCLDIMRTPMKSFDEMEEEEQELNALAPEFMDGDVVLGKVNDVPSFPVFKGEILNAPEETLNVVEFTFSWCRPCKKFAAKYDMFAEYYDKVTSSRKYEDRLNTIAAVREAGISVCCGGILGLGEEESDRASLMTVLATLPEHPESVPINALVPVEGTPFKDMTPPSGLEMVRAIAVARILMPATVVRLSAGRVNMSPETQALCFMAGANSVFTGDKLLTTPNNEKSEDSFLFEELGLEGRPAFVPYAAGAASSDGSEWKHMKHEL